MPDKITTWYLAAVAFVGLIYFGFGWTPSSYGVILDQIQAPDAGPVLGTPRSIRADEWALDTPLFQAVVRNHFRRVNETSFYREDLRNFHALPLADWSLIFKPQMWAFFVLPPAAAFSLYWAFLMCGFLAGYFLLFRRLELPSWLAALSAVLLYFTGFVQFWWTTFAPLLAGFPWILLLILQPAITWKKALLCAWAFPAFVLAHSYPTLLITLAWGALIVILAFRPSALCSRANLVALSIGFFAALSVVYLYYADVIPVMLNTIHPGHRVSPSGGTPLLVVLSQVFPFLTFNLADYQPLTPPNICEIAAAGSFLPLLTLCLARYRSLKGKTLLILAAAFTVFTVYEVAHLPSWFGRLLLWNTGAANRWLFTSGLLLILLSLAIWKNQLVSLHPLRIILFAFAGPVASTLLKLAWLIHRGSSPDAACAACLADFVICALAIALCIALCYVPIRLRAPILLTAVALMNVFAFGGFNPLQPAQPIFQVPETKVVQELRTTAAASPGVLLVDPRFLGATLNGMGFRSVGHVLLAPKLEFFRPYFPAMDPDRFNWIFNRYAYIRVTQDPLPALPADIFIDLPAEPFLPVRNVRTVAIRAAQPKPCALAIAGGITQVSPSSGQLTIEGWAPWQAETNTQGIRVLSARPLHPISLETITRPDIAEQLRDYRFVKAGFRLRIAGAGGNPLRTGDLVLVAFGTSQGEVRLTGGGCS